MVERRSELRMQASEQVTILFNDGTGTADGVLRDVSLAGARVELANSAEIPDTLELVIKKDGIRHPAKVVWRTFDEIGIEFTLVRDDARQESPCA